MKNQDMRTSINYLIMNLAVADMTVATFFIPQYILTHTFTHPGGVAGNVLCRLLTGSNLAWVGGAVSVFTLVTIAIERHYAVIYPYGNKGKLCNRKLKVLILCSWVFGVILNIPGFLVKNFDEEARFCIRSYPKEWMGKAFTLTWFLVLGFLPVALMVALYVRVVYTLWFKGQELDRNKSRQGVMKVRKRVTLMVITVSAIFAVCWLADCMTYLLAFYTPKHTVGGVAYVATSAMIQLNSAVNPIVYALVNQRFRQKIKRMVCCPCLPGNSSRESLRINSVSHTTKEEKGEISKEVHNKATGLVIRTLDL